MKIVFVGGGTGGHFFPILAIIRKLKELSPEKLELIFVGPNDFGKELLKKEEVKFFRITTGKLRRYFSLKNFFDSFKLCFGLLWALVFLYRQKPELVFGKGGYGALPLGLAAALFKIPLFIHESDVVPGLTNRILGRFARVIFISFPETKRYFSQKRDVYALGNPLREELLKQGLSKEERNFFRIEKKKKPIVLILGGSQGAEEINRLIFRFLKELLENFFLIHVVGKNNFSSYQKTLKETYPKLNLSNYRVFSFLNGKQLAAAYRLCDVVVTRAGSGAIFELAAFKKPALLIPFQDSASNHQKENAYAYAKRGAALVVERPNLKPHLFLETLKGLLGDKERLNEMSKAAEKFASPKAAEKIAKAILAFAKTSGMSRRE